VGMRVRTSIGGTIGAVSDESREDSFEITSSSVETEREEVSSKGIDGEEIIWA